MLVWCDLSVRGWRIFPKQENSSSHVSKRRRRWQPCLPVANICNASSCCARVLIWIEEITHVSLHWKSSLAAEREREMQDEEGRRERGKNAARLYGNVGQIYHSSLTVQFSYLLAAGRWKRTDPRVGKTTTARPGTDRNPLALRRPLQTMPLRMRRQIANKTFARPFHDRMNLMGHPDI